MCNFHSLTKGQEEIRSVARAMSDVTGNLPPMPGIFPDYPAPIVRNVPDGECELLMARWRMPTPPTFLMGKKTDRGVTNVRNVASPHWRRWLVLFVLVPIIFVADGRGDRDGLHLAVLAEADGLLRHFGTRHSAQPVPDIDAIG
jgi:putative SOS response-associated peptidase YedK